MKLNRKLANNLLIAGLSIVALSFILDILTKFNNPVSPVLLVGGFSLAAVGNIMKWFVKK